MRSILGLFNAIILMGLLSCCSANWHLKKAIKKNPDLLQSGEIITIETPPVGFDFNCDSIAKKNGVTLVIPREYKDQNGKVKRDSVRIKIVPQKLTGEDSLRIGQMFTAEVDCPDAQTILIPVTTKWYQSPLNWVSIGIIAIALINLIGIFKRKPP